MVVMSNPEMNGTPADALHDAEIVASCLAAGRPVPPDVARRVQARADDARRQLLAARGVQASGVDLIREGRGELPNS